MFVNGLEVGNDGRVLTSLVPVALTDPAGGGFTYDPLTGGVKAAQVAPVYYANGWPFNAGQLCVGDGPATSYRNGLGFNSAGQLVVDGTGTVVSARGGWPMTSVGVAIKPTAPSGYGAKDPIYSKVIYLSDMENSTAVIDTAIKAPVGNSTSAGGFSAFNTVRPKFGARGYQTGSNNDRYATTTSILCGAGDWCIECWLYPTVIVTASWRGIFFWNQQYQNLRLMTDGHLEYFTGTGTVHPSTINITTPAATIGLNSWHFVQLMKINGITKVGVNGVQVGNSYVDTNNYTNDLPQWLGCGNLAMGFEGFADTIRFTVGATGELAADRSICLPTAAFPTSA